MSYLTVAVLEPALCYLRMEHQGVRYELRQTTNPSGWKWIAYVGERHPAGFSSSKDLAIHAAKRAIEKALKEAEDKKK